jgi:protein phosphatase PTC7
MKVSSSAVMFVLSAIDFPLSCAFLGQQMVSKAIPTSTSTCLWDAPEALAEEGSWQAFLDEETTGLIYYFDTKTGESLWEPPTATFPEVRLPRRKQRLADSLRREYRKSRQQEMMGDTTSSTFTAVVEEEEAPTEERPSWIDGIFDTETKEDVQQTPVEQPQQWFNFGGNKVDTAVIADEEKEKTEAPEPQNWLKDIFGVGKSAADAATEDRVTEETAEERRKFGILESFASFSSAPAAATAATVTEEETAVVETPKPAPKTVKVVEEKPKKKEEKIVDLTPKPIKIEMGSHILPHPAKVRWGGEDAVFTKGRTFGVFDGVSGADKLDGVPLYSRTLANEMKKMVGAEGVTVQDMTNYLTTAAAYADGAATGASTAVVASIGENGFLQALNVGDSYCVVIRDGKITAKTREISHYWECPYQLSEDSPDRPRDGTKLNVELIPGDVVIMGSDGVFDNVSDDLLLDLVTKAPSKATSLAKKICDLSRKQSLDRNSETPYAKQAQRRGDPDYRSGLGGKVDDVSCVVVLCK